MASVVGLEMNWMRVLRAIINYILPGVWRSEAFDTGIAFQEVYN